RDTGELGELEVDRAEAVEEADEAVGMAAAEREVDGAKGTPGWGEGAVEFFVADAAEELGVGGGAASGDSAEGAALAEKAAEVEDGAGLGYFGVVLGKMLREKKRGGGAKRRKGRQGLARLPTPATSGVAPDSM